MKRLLLLLALVPLLACAADPAPAPVETLNELKVLAEQAPVAAIDLVLPSDEQEIAKALWDRFANKPEEKRFAVVTTRDWKAKWDLLANVLIEKARKHELDGVSLRACLEALNKGLTADTAPQPISEIPEYPVKWSDGTVSFPESETKTSNSAQTTEPKAPPSQAEADIVYGEPPDAGLEATIPVGAYLARTANGPCWIIVCKWEMAHHEHLNARLGHIRIWAVDSTTHKIIGFIGCD